MNWTDPRSWVTNEVVTSSLLNTHIRDNERSLMHTVTTPATADLEIVNTTTETTLYSVTIPGNSLGTYGSLALEAICDAKGTSNNTHVLTTRVKWGGSTVTSWVMDWVNRTTYEAFPIYVWVANRGATNSQLVWAEGYVGAAVTTQKNWTALPPMTAAADTTADQTLSVTAQWGVAEATNSIRRRWARTLIGQN